MGHRTLARPLSERVPEYHPTRLNSEATKIIVWLVSTICGWSVQNNLQGSKWVIRIGEILGLIYSWDCKHLSLRPSVVRTKTARENNRASLAHPKNLSNLLQIWVMRVKCIVSPDNFNYHPFHVYAFTHANTHTAKARQLLAIITVTIASPPI